MFIRTLNETTIIGCSDHPMAFVASLEPPIAHLLEGEEYLEMVEAN